MKKRRRRTYQIIRTIFGMTIVSGAAWLYLGSYGVVAPPLDVILGRQTEHSLNSDSEEIPVEETGAAVITPAPTQQPPEAVLENIEMPWQIEQVPHIYQYDAYPTGCESVSAVTALQFSGVDISVDDFIDHYLTIGNLWEEEDGRIVGPDMDDAYIGDPRSTHGCGCNAPAIMKALRKLLSGTNCKAVNLTGMELKELCRNYIRKDIPVILWATIGMQEWTETVTWESENGAGTVTFYTAEHCLVLTGYDEEFYYFSDPASTEVRTAYKREAVEHAYEKLGCQAIAVLPQEEEDS